MRNSIEIHWINPKFIPELWDGIKPKLEPAVKYADGKHTLDSIRKDVMSGDMQLWVVCRTDNKKVVAVTVTQIIPYPAKRVCSISFAGGDLGGDWEIARETSDKLCAWAKKQGCNAVEIWGRPGWRRVHTEGWDTIHTVLRKNLDAS